MSHRRGSPPDTPLILWIQGPPDSGKTGIALALGTVLAARLPTLLVDACSDRGLMRRAGPTGTETMATPLERLFFGPEAFATFLSPAGAMSQEAREQLDWRFRDALHELGEGLDVLALGALPPAVSPGAARALAYGVPRVLSEYGFVVIDGAHPALEGILRAFEPPPVPLWLITPYGELPPWQTTEGLGTPVVVIHGESADTPLPSERSQWLEALIAVDDARLLARIPRLDATEEGGAARARDTGRALEEGLLRLGMIAR